MAKSVWAIVTGASSGIGKEFAMIFAEHGVNLVISSRNKNALRSLAKELKLKHKIKVAIFATDLSHHDNVTKLVDFVSKHKIYPEHLVNNAGFGDYGNFIESKWDKIDSIIDLNIKTLTYLTKIYAIDMKRRGYGKILNIASVAAFQPGPLMAVYFATKAYVLHFSEAVAEELSGSGVTITTLCPGATKSNFWVAAGDVRRMDDRSMSGAHIVARYGYDAMMRGKRVAIEGFWNRFMTILIRLMPRDFVTRAVRRNQEHN